MRIVNSLTFRWGQLVHSLRLRKRRKYLKNTNPTIIAGNCIGGFIYHWLKLPFNSPFINLCLSNEDFLYAMENFDEFINSPITEVKGQTSYPLGQALNGKILLHFMHYKTFDQAIEKWNERKYRINKNNLFIILPNIQRGQEKIIQRFKSLPYKNKIGFSDYNTNENEIIYIPNWPLSKGKGLFDFSNKLTGKRIIDRFDYIEWLNH